MKQITLRLIAFVLALAAVCSLPVTAAGDASFEKQYDYSFCGMPFICTASAERIAPEVEEIYYAVTYSITFEFASFSDPVTALMNEYGLMINNFQTGMDHVYRQELWNVIAEYCLDFYSFAFGKDMTDRSLDGVIRELQMHYWVCLVITRLNQLFAPLEPIADKVPKLKKIFNMIDDIRFHAEITDVGPCDGSDPNGYVFEQSNSAAQALLTYCTDFFSFDNMEDIIELTDKCRLTPSPARIVLYSARTG